LLQLVQELQIGGTSACRAPDHCRMTHPVKPGRVLKAGIAVINGFDGSINRLRLAAPALAD
jgi:hypothetical protein